MLSIDWHQRNTNQNHNDILFHVYQDGYNKKGWKITSAGEEVENWNSCMELLGI